MIDWHNHVLPAMDDGSRSVAESMTMLRAQTAQGVIGLGGSHDHKFIFLPEDIDLPDWVTDKQIREIIGEGVPPLMSKAFLKEII